MYLQENPVGSGTGNYHGRQLFTTKIDHAALFPVDGLIKAEDFDTKVNGKHSTTNLNNSAEPLPISVNNEPSTSDSFQPGNFLNIKK